MNTDQIFNDIQALNDLIYKINKREPEAIKELNRLNRIVFGETVIAGCSNCHIKAFRRLTTLSIEDLKTMEEQKFKIKKGILVEFPFRSGQFFSAALGVTNELAIEYLTAHPDKIDQFEVYPGSESESKKLDLSEVNPQATKEVSRMNKSELQKVYATVIGSEADDSLSKNDLIKAIETAANKHP